MCRRCRTSGIALCMPAGSNNRSRRNVSMPSRPPPTTSPIDPADDVRRATGVVPRRAWPASHRERRRVGGHVVLPGAEQHLEAMAHRVVDVVLDPFEPRPHVEQILQGDRFFRRALPARDRRPDDRVASRPSPTRIPTAAWVMLLAMLHEISVVSAVTGPPLPKTESGCIPYRSNTTSP